MLVHRGSVRTERRVLAGYTCRRAARSLRSAEIIPKCVAKCSRGRCFSYLIFLIGGGMNLLTALKGCDRSSSISQVVTLRSLHAAINRIGMFPVRFFIQPWDFPVCAGLWKSYN